jgi:hypothetical protein
MASRAKKVTVPGGGLRGFERPPRTLTTEVTEVTKAGTEDILRKGYASPLIKKPL